MATGSNGPVEPTVPSQGILVETEALKALLFYLHNYTQLTFAGLGSGNQTVILGSKPFACRFCGGKPPESTFKKRPHAVSELLGNKVMKSLYECDTCNERFGRFEDDLGKMSLPARSIGGGDIGKDGVPTLVIASRERGRRPTMKFKLDGLHVSHDARDIGFVEDEAAKTLTVTYVVQPYRPLGVYKALCKSAFTLMHADELTHFEELRQWLLQDDLTTDQVYARGSYVCHTIFVQGFKPFKQPIVCLMKRSRQTDAPYMSFFIATGNVSYQLFLPCPSQDAHLAGKTIMVPAFPHFFQLQPRLIPCTTLTGHIDLGAPERTEKRNGSMTWHYENKTKVA